MGQQHRDDIDGLRAVAVGLVLIFHAFPAWLPGGFIGVDVFFVISGFVITNKYLPLIAQRRFRLRDFYAARVRRLFPALALVLGVTLVAGWFLLFPADFERLARHAVASALFVPNFVFWSEVDYFNASPKENPLLHLWSLGIEEQFYLVWPLLLVVLSWRPRRIVPILIAIVAASLAYSIYAAWYTPAAGFYSPLSRFWELGIGGLLAVRPAKLPNLYSHAGLSIIVGSAFFLDEADAFPGLLAVLPVAGSALIVASRSSLLATSPMVAIGRISYPLYLWHWPLMSFAAFKQIDTPAVMAAAIASSVVLAALTYWYVEQPVRRGRLAHWTVPVTVSAMATAATCAVIVLAGAGFPQRYDTYIRSIVELKQYKFADSARFPDCWLNDEETFKDYAADCHKGSTLIWGDSHAARLYPGLASLFGEVAQFTRSSCYPQFMTEKNPCGAGNIEIAKEIARLKPERVIIFAAWMQYWQNWSPDWPQERLVRKMLQGLRVAGVRDIVVLGPSPYWDPFLPEVVYAYWKKHSSLPDRLVPAARDYRNADAVLRKIAREEGARFISLYDAICDERGCLTHTPDSPSDLLSWDYGHFTTPGAKFIAELAFGRSDASLHP